MKFKEDSPNAAFIRNLKDVVDTLLAEYEIKMNPLRRIHMVCSLWISFMCQMAKQNSGQEVKPTHLINVDWRDFMGMMEDQNND